MQVQFGPGAAWVERVDLTGSGIGPRFMGITMQDLSLDIEWTMKKLMGQFQFPAAIARADAKITGKIRFPETFGRLLSDIVFGTTAATGQLSVAQDESGTVPASTPYTVTVANAANFELDLGVRYAATGIPFNRVTTPASAGQYSVNPSTGVYTFAAADANAAVLISYSWNNSSTGLKSTLTNQLMGVTPQFKLTYVNRVSPGPPGAGGQTLPFGVRLNASTANKLSAPTKVDDWMIQELDFESFADAAGIVGYFSSVQ